MPWLQVSDEVDEIANFEASIIADDGDYFLVQIVVKANWRRMIEVLTSCSLRLFECRLDLIAFCSERRVLSESLLEDANGTRFANCAGNGARMERLYKRTKRNSLKVTFSFETKQKETNIGHEKSLVAFVVR